MWIKGKSWQKIKKITTKIRPIESGKAEINTKVSICQSLGKYDVVRVPRIIFLDLRNSTLFCVFILDATLLFMSLLGEKVNETNGVYDLEAELASLTMLLTDIPGEDGPSPLDAVIGLELPLILLLAALIKGFLVWHVAVEIAVAREIGMRQRPLPCKYCMADPMSSSISLATWCSVIVRLPLEDDAVLGFRGWTPPLPFVWTQSLTPCKEKRTRVTVKGREWNLRK